MPSELVKRGPHHAAYMNGRSDARWDIERGILDRDTKQRNRYGPPGAIRTGAFARRWQAGYEEVRRELLPAVAQVPPLPPAPGGSARGEEGR
jgi:hypothetical protein